MDSGLQYWQQLGQQEQAEQESLIECMEWYEARRDQFNTQESLTQGIESCSFEKQNAAKQS